MVEEEGFAATAPCRTEALLGFVVRGTIVEGVDDVWKEHVKPKVPLRNELQKVYQF
jgi:hypothetical protein